MLRLNSSGNESSLAHSFCLFSRQPTTKLLFHFIPNVSNCAGCKQNGTKLGDVILPPWAKGDPREFIRVHREVRESWVP